MIVLPKTRFFSNLKRGGKYNHNFYHQWKDRAYVNRGDYIFGGVLTNAQIEGKFPIVKQVQGFLKEHKTNRTIFVSNRKQMEKTYKKLAHVNALLRDAKEGYKLIDMQRKENGVKVSAGDNIFYQNILRLGEIQANCMSALQQYDTMNNLGKEDKKLIDVIVDKAKEIDKIPLIAKQGPSLIPQDEEDIDWGKEERIRPPSSSSSSAVLPPPPRPRPQPIPLPKILTPVDNSQVDLTPSSSSSSTPTTLPPPRDIPKVVTTDQVPTVITKAPPTDVPAPGTAVAKPPPPHVPTPSTLNIAKEEQRKASELVRLARTMKTPADAKDMELVQEMWVRAQDGEKRCDSYTDQLNSNPEVDSISMLTWNTASQQYQVAKSILDKLIDKWSLSEYNTENAPSKPKKLTQQDVKNEKIMAAVALQKQKTKDLENAGVVKMEKNIRERWDNLVSNVAIGPRNRGNALEEFSRWDPINNPLNSVNNRNYYNNYIPMDNRLEQAVPPYDLPKNYPVYGGNGYYDYTNSYQPNMPSARSMNFGRKGRTGRRTNWEKFGRPSLRTARDMIRYGLLPPGYEGLRGNPASSYVATYKPYPMPISHPSTTLPEAEPNYPAYYSDPGPLDALTRGASALLYGPRQFTSTPNQMFPTSINNTSSALPGNMYKLAGLVDRARGPQLSAADQLRNIKNYAEAAKLINDQNTGLTADQKATAMGIVNKAMPVASTLGTVAAVASAGLKALGWGAENFWPLHDAYHRFNTRRNIYNTVGKVTDFFTGRGYKRRRRRRKVGYKKGSGLHTRKLKFGGKIIPPKSLKKMFSKECNCTNN